MYSTNTNIELLDTNEAIEIHLITELRGKSWIIYNRFDTVEMNVQF